MKTGPLRDDLQNALIAGAAAATAFLLVVWGRRITKTGIACCDEDELRRIAEKSGSKGGREMPGHGLIE